MIGAPTVVCLGVTQLIAWGISFYLIGNFGPAMAADLGWSLAAVYGGFSLAILVMALVSPLAGRSIDRWGGHCVMPAGAILNALGCAGLACSHTGLAYAASWALLGTGMRLTLYDAAFATLARIAGPGARQAMSQITLFGGLASTVMWPAGHALAEAMGWRGAVLAYAGLSLATLPFFLALPRARFPSSAAATAQPAGGLAQTAQERRLGAWLFAVITMLSNFLAAGNSAHLLSMLTGMGLAASAAVSVSALWGVGQVSARLAEVLFGRRVPPLALNLLTACLLPWCFVAGLAAGHYAAAAAYAFFYGACNGLLTITRGTLPLVLFDYRGYGALTGTLLVPSFVFTAAAPLIYAQIIDGLGVRTAMAGSAMLACAILGASLWLARRFGWRGECATPPH